MNTNAEFKQHLYQLPKGVYLWYVDQFLPSWKRKKSKFIVPKYYSNTHNVILQQCLSRYKLPIYLGNIISHYAWSFTFQNDRDIAQYIKLSCLHIYDKVLKVHCSVSFNHFGVCYLCLKAYDLCYVVHDCFSNPDCKITCMDCVEKQFTLCNICDEWFCEKYGLVCVGCLEFVHAKHTVNNGDKFVCKECIDNVWVYP